MKSVEEYKIEIEKLKLKNDYLVKSLWEITSEASRLETIIEYKDKELKELQIMHNSLIEDHEKLNDELEFYKQW